MKAHTDSVATDAKAGNALVSGKHVRNDVIAQLTNVIDSFKTVGIEIPADAVPAPEVAAGDAKPEGEGDAKPDGEAEVEKEGGEDAAEVPAPVDGGDAAATAMEITDPRKAHTDDGNFAGFAEIPACFLRNAIVNEYFGDLLKTHIIAVQFLQAKGQSTNTVYAGAAGYLTSGLATSAKTESEVWFSGLVGELDQASLAELKKDAPLSFPGFLVGWTSEVDATNYLKALASADKKDVHQVVVHATGAPAVAVLGNRLACHRLAGTVTDDAKFDEATKTTTVNLTSAAYDERTIGESVIAAAAVPVVEVPAGDAKPEGEGEAKPEGEVPAGDAPEAPVAAE